MEQLPAFGKAISKVVAPTFKAYEPLILANADAIRPVAKSRQTYQYGPHERQQLDVYRASEPSLKNGRQSVILFLYGGGLIYGSKTLPGFAEDLCHANMATFFGAKCGYSFVVADYRLVNTHNAKFPSGGEDVSLAVEWITANAESAFGSEPIDLFIMGNSAGGVHVSTFLLEPTFAEMRAKVLSSEKVRWRGVILLSVPFHFDLATDNRADVLETYFGDHQAKCPLGLLRVGYEKGSLDFLKSDLRVLVLNGELDSDNEIMIPRDDFVKQWLALESVESRNALDVQMMKGQNHISPFLSLSTGLEHEEAWGYQIAGFCGNLTSFKI